VPVGTNKVDEWCGCGYRRALLVLIIFASGLLVFWPGVDGQFIYDDHVDIRNVDHVFAPGGWLKLFQTASAQLYRPVKYLSYYLDNLWFGWNPTGWHWQSFLWHALNGVLVYALARRFAASAIAAALGALWFAIHPVHAEAVVWISSRASLQSTSGVLLMLLCYVRWRETGQKGDFIGMLAGGFIGFFSKEDALMVFPVIAAYEVFVRKESPLGLLKQRSFMVPVFSLGLIALIYLGLRQSILSGLKQGGWEAGFTGWIATLPVILATYLRQLIWPDPLCIDQPVNYAAGFGAAFWLSSMILAAWVGCLFLRHQSLARWQFAITFFFITLVPVMGLIPINQPRADRFLYLPSVAAAMALAWAWDALRAQPRWRSAGLAFMVATLGWFCWRSWDYAKTFQNDRVLWEQVITVNPQSYRGFANLAAAENNDGRADNGLVLIERSLSIKPQYPEGWVIKAFSLSQLGKLSEAEQLYRDAIKSAPEEARWLYLLADLLERQKRYGEAMQTYEQIVKVRPSYVEARLSAGVLAAQLGKPALAKEHWEAVLQYDPANSAARQNLEILRRANGK
jgi:tetratricopeptide (TPR) repeat protein